jgi:glutamate racemase
VLGDSVTLVSSAEECAKSTWTTLNGLGLLHHTPRDATRRFLTTGNPEKFEGIGSRLMGGFVADVGAVW